MTIPPTRRPGRAPLRIPLTVKFSLVVGAQALVLLVAVQVVTQRAVRRPMTENLLKKGQSLAAQLAANSADAILNGDDMLVASYIDRLREEPGLLYALVLDRKGRVRAHSDLSIRPGTALPPDPEQPAGEEPTPRIRPITAGGVRGDEFRAPVDVRGRSLGSVRVALSEAELTAAQSDIARRLAGVAVGAIFVGIVSTILVGRWLLRGVGLITGAAHRIGAGDLSVRISLRSRDELSELADTISGMAGALEAHQRSLVEQARIRSELEVARAVQLALIPKETPVLPGVELAALYRPAWETSGDYYDFFRIDDRRLAIVVADVCGKGVGAALITTACRSEIRAEARGAASPAAVLRSVNRELSRTVELQGDRFITAVLAFVDARARRIVVANAGHTALLRVPTGDAPVERIASTGLPLCSGFDDEFERSIEDTEVRLRVGESYLLFTDGLPEALNASKQEWGNPALVDCLERNRSRSPTQILAGLSAAVEAHAAGARQSDDWTAVALTVGPPAPAGAGP